MTSKEAIDMAIKALQQEPCEDAISRQSVRIDMPRNSYCPNCGAKMEGSEV